MKKTLTGSVELGELTLDYYLISRPRSDRRTDYGVELRSSRGEVSRVPGITVSCEEADSLLACLIRNTVTPTTLRDVVDDWLL